MTLMLCVTNIKKKKSVKISTEVWPCIIIAYIFVILFVYDYTSI